MGKPFVPKGRRFLCIGLMILAGTAPRADGVENSVRQAPPPSPQICAKNGDLPLSFEVNAGQTACEVDFLARNGAYTLFLTQGDAVLRLDSNRAKGKQKALTPGGSAVAAVVRMRLVGASESPPVVGEDALPGLESEE